MQGTRPFRTKGGDKTGLYFSGLRIASKKNDPFTFFKSLAGRKVHPASYSKFYVIWFKAEKVPWWVNNILIIISSFDK
jgi:hypothetical protein